MPRPLQCLPTVIVLWATSRTCEAFMAFRYTPNSSHTKLFMRASPSDFAEQSRRKFLLTGLASALLTNTIQVPAAYAVARSTSEAKITDKIFIDINGLPTEEGVVEANNRIVIGLFGDDAPGPVSLLKQLVSKEGLRAKCRPREERVLQKEQLEANKVYNSCIENEDNGVTYDLSQVWRVSKDKRIDLGAVSGRYIAREFPEFSDGGSSSGLKHDSPGVVSVRRGNDGGFGFTIYPGGEDAGDLDKDNIVVGRVLEGMDTVLRINYIPVVQAARVNYKALAGGEKERVAPSRACRYGSANLYCNELKPLKKLTISRTGIVT